MLASNYAHALYVKFGFRKQKTPGLLSKPGRHDAPVTGSLLDPEKQVYAYCTRTAERASPNWSYIDLTLKQNRIVGVSKNDYRCRDKRLRYYDFPELLNMKS